jgi:hypothetical protein
MLNYQNIGVSMVPVHGFTVNRHEFKKAIGYMSGYFGNLFLDDSIRFLQEMALSRGFLIEHIVMWDNARDYYVDEADPTPEDFAIMDKKAYDLMARHWLSHKANQFEGIFKTVDRQGKSHVNFRTQPCGLQITPWVESVLNPDIPAHRSLAINPITCKLNPGIIIEDVFMIECITLFEHESDFIIETKYDGCPFPIRKIIKKPKGQKFSKGRC